MKTAALMAFLLAFGLSASATFAQGLDLRAPFDRLMDEGAAAYAEERFEDAATAFRDARLMRPRSAEAILNLGLAEARRGNHETALELFREARQHLPAEDKRRADTLYNEGTALLDEAGVLLDGEETREQAVDKILESITRFGEALEADPLHQHALHNKIAAQNLLARMEPPPPPQEQQGSGESEDNEEQQDQQESDSSQNEQNEESDPNEQPNQGESDGENNDENQNRDQNDSSSQDQQQDQQPPDNSEPEEGEPDDAKPEEGESEETEPQEAEGVEAAPASARPDEMTPEEARQLLNLLGNRELMIFGQPRTSQPPPGGRDW